MNRRHPEDEIQRTIAQHLRMRGVKDLVGWHTPSGMQAGSPTQAARMKGLGWRAGISDWILVHAGKIHCLELKAPGGRATEAQLEFLADMERAGAYCAVAVGLEQALVVLEQWGLLRGRAS